MYLLAKKFGFHHLVFNSLVYMTSIVDQYYIAISLIPCAGVFPSGPVFGW